MAAPPRRRKLLGHRRRLEDEGEDEGGPDVLAVEDDSLTDGSVVSDDHDLADDSDTSNVEEVSPTSPVNRDSRDGATNKHGHGKGNSNVSAGKNDSGTADGEGDAGDLVTTAASVCTKVRAGTAIPDTGLMGGKAVSAEQLEPSSWEEGGASSQHTIEWQTQSPLKAATTGTLDRLDEPQANNRRRREHDDYRRKRDEDPAFVPNRGAFFMHDHRHAGPSANGFRPFDRGGRGRGRGGQALAGPYTSFGPQQRLNSQDPIVAAPWSHDMHETVTEPLHSQQTRPAVPRSRAFVDEGLANGNGHIPTRPPNATPINRTLSTEKHIGNVPVRVYIPSLPGSKVLPAMAVKQYTKLPDHRPPLRRDKPVRISLPDRPPRYVFPAADRSFIFIPRPLRPNQQRVQGKTRSAFGSVSAFSWGTSVFGGSYYNGSSYSASIALSRRSSMAPSMGREHIMSPTDSAVSRQPMAGDGSRPVVRLPPSVEQIAAAGQTPANGSRPLKPALHDGRASHTPMHQPRPYKEVPVEYLEPSVTPQPQQALPQACHHQMPAQVSSDGHNRNSSYPSTGTPLSQIPESAIHAAPFQPIQYLQQGPPNIYPPFAMAPPPPGFFYGPPGPFTAAMPTGIPEQQVQARDDNSLSEQAVAGSNLVAQEANGMVYYYDASQLPPMPTFPAYIPAQPFPASVGGVMSINGMVTPSPDGFYYPQPTNGAVYYAQ